jgi:hypothetical protein
VNSDLVEHVGLLNYSWANNDGKLNTKMEVMDPGDALRQVLQSCDEVSACHNARKVLLAQMPSAQANELAARFQEFDVVVTQADTNLSTPAGEIIGAREHPFMLTPKVSVEATANNDAVKRRLRIQKADIRTGPPYQLTTAVQDTEQAIELHEGFGEVLRSRIENSRLKEELDVKSNPSDSELLENLALFAMRDHCKADVALLQHRDVYDAQRRMKDPAGDLLHVLDEAFWKGDLVICTQVAGATLKDSMTQSDKFDADDRDELSTTLEKSRGLSVLGMVQDPLSKQWIIAGVPLDPAKLYSVGIPDYLATGDTGYPSLGKPAVPPPDRLQTREYLAELASISCAVLQGSECRPPVYGYEYFDGSTLQPYDKAPTSHWTWLSDWFQHNLRIRDLTESAKRVQTTEQQQRQLSLTLDKLDFGYTLHLHNLSENQLKTSLAGVQLSAITASEERDFSGDYSYRVLSAGRIVDRFVTGQTNYADRSSRVNLSHTLSNGTKVFDDPYILNQLQNSFIQEEGLGWHLYPHKKNLSFLKLQTTAHLETQLVQPGLQLQLVDQQAPGSPPQPSLPDGVREIPRTYYMLGRVGPRLQGEKSWIEGGFESGEQFNKPVFYTFLPPGVNSTASNLAVRCNLSSLSSVQDCVKNPNAAGNFVARDWKLGVSTVNRPRSGYIPISKSTCRLRYPAWDLPSKTRARYFGMKVLTRDWTRATTTT